MANFTTSPGVTLNEIDNTFLTAQPVQAGAAIVGPTVKGPIERPTLVTTYSDYVSIFGDTFTSASDTFSFLTSISAYSYFNYGGDSLLVTRVASGSFLPSTSSVIPTGSADVSGSFYNLTYAGTVSPFSLTTIGEGVIMDNDTLASTYYTNGVLDSGTTNNLKFEITAASTSSGNFNLIVRQGNDIQNKKIILETWNKVNLNPKSPRYIAKVIGDQTSTYDVTNQQVVTTGDYPNNSRYIRVSAVTLKTPDYLDASGQPKNEFTSSIPAVGAGVFGGGTGDVKSGANMYENISTQTQGLEAANYTNALNILKNKDAYQFNVLFTPGLLDDTHTSTITTAITNTIARGDYLYVPDLVTYNSSIAEAINQANTRDTSFAASYFPWVKILDPGTGKQVWVPASTVVPGVYAYNDKVAAPWFAPAGINRGGLNTVLQAKYKLTQANKDNLYDANVNPLATLSREGVVVFGQKTLQKEASALDRVNVRRLVIALKNYIGQLADQIVFEQNTIATRQSFIAKVTPYLEMVQQKQGLYAFKVLMDDSNNGPDVIDRNQLIGQIYIQPTRTAEFISLDFILMPTGAEFPS
jgi:hypothetical protein|tara:strand:+ start:4051 stop:5796 length:1746 start_codon:yes stop_codon:yes gene_type:complete